MHAQRTGLCDRHDIHQAALQIDVEQMPIGGAGDAVDRLLQKLVGEGMRHAAGPGGASPGSPGCLAIASLAIWSVAFATCSIGRITSTAPVRDFSIHFCMVARPSRFIFASSGNMPSRICPVRAASASSWVCADACAGLRGSIATCLPSIVIFSIAPDFSSRYL